MNRDFPAAAIGLHRLVGSVVNDPNEPRTSFVLVDILDVELSQLFTTGAGISGHQWYPVHGIARSALSMSKLLKLVMAE